MKIFPPSLRCFSTLRVPFPVLARVGNTLVPLNGSVPTPQKKQLTGQVMAAGAFNKPVSGSLATGPLVTSQTPTGVSRVPLSTLQGNTTTPASKTSAKRPHSATDTGLDDSWVTTNSDDEENDDEELITFDKSCDQIRTRIRALIDSGEMKVTEFQRTIGVSSRSYGNFMKMKGPWAGVNNGTFSGATRFFREREAKGIPAPKKRKVTAEKATELDVSGVSLPEEETGKVPVYDTCDEVRRKISAHLRGTGVTQASLLRDFSAQIPGNPKIQSKQLTDFRAKHGPSAGNTSRVFYGGYVYFEKLRIKQNKEKSKHRQEMEKAHPQGFDVTTPSSRGYLCLAGDVPVEDQYGRVSIQRNAQRYR